MPIIIQETSVQVEPQEPSNPPTGGTNLPSPIVPLRPTDVERIQRYLAERRARLRAD